MAPTVRRVTAAITSHGSTSALGLPSSVLSALISYVTQHFVFVIYYQVDR
jgi:hypothetical protein